jgi:hypothetical protein
MPILLGSACAIRNSVAGDERNGARKKRFENTLEKLRLERDAIVCFERVKANPVSGLLRLEFEELEPALGKKVP